MDHTHWLTLVSSKIQMLISKFVLSLAGVRQLFQQIWGNTLVLESARRHAIVLRYVINTPDQSAQGQACRLPPQQPIHRG